MANASGSKQGRWEGRNSKKDELRMEIWSTLEREGVSIGSVYSRIPNFQGAEEAAARLAELPIWKNAEVVKCNPDAPQIPVRLRALQDGKILYTPVPELAKEFPFVELDPEDLEERGIPFETAARKEGALKHGRRVQFQEMKPFDIVLVGSVAVTRAGGRIGKGGGFADLELGIFWEMNLVNQDTPIVTTVHALQVVADNRIEMTQHNSPLNWIITPDEDIETNTQYPISGGVYWDDVEEDQLRDIPFLRDLKERLSRK